jgi:hypothetical protein
VSESNRTPILVGGDLELGNFIYDENEPDTRSDFEASRLLLRHISGFPRENGASGSSGSRIISPAYPEFQAFYGAHHGSDSQDSGRQYLASNGGCAYIDLNHLELATPETLSARDQLLKRQLYPNVFSLMSYQASSLIFTGQGKVGSENGEPFVPYQISQRADFIETLLGEQTTSHRPLVNTRDEPLAGPTGRHGDRALPGDRYARLHVIFYDTTLAPVATCLKVGVFQLILAMIEADALDDSLILDDPLAAVRTWSRSPDLDATMRLRSGRSLTAIELQLEFLQRAHAFGAAGGFDGIVADARDILWLWEDTLARLETRDSGLRARLDWVMKRDLLETALANNPGYDWTSPELRYMDLLFSSIDPDDSLYLHLQAAGLIEPVATEAEIARLVVDPPENTRAFGRAMLLRAIAASTDFEVTHVDWDEIRLRARHGSSDSFAVQLSDPLGATRSQTAAALEASGDLAALMQNLQRAGVVRVTRTQWPSRSTSAGLIDEFRTPTCN